MYEDEPLKSWVGEPVEVSIIYGGTGESGTLVSLNDLGVVLETQSEEAGTGVDEGLTIVTTHYTLYPWHTVGWVRKTAQITRQH